LPAEQVLTEVLLHQGDQFVEAFAHVGHASRQPHRTPAVARSSAQHYHNAAQYRQTNVIANEQAQAIGAT
jgi:hypothetical protein